MNATTAWGLFLFFAGGLLWLRSGRDPIYWTIAMLIVVRAALAAAAEEAWSSIARWWVSLPAAIERSRKECLHRDA